MLIERILKVPGGAHITLDKDAYHFAPNDEGDQVCNVADTGHCELLLAITDAFRVYGDEARAEYESMLAEKELVAAEEHAQTLAAEAKEKAKAAAVARNAAKEREARRIEAIAEKAARAEEEQRALKEAHDKRENDKAAARAKIAKD